MLDLTESMSSRVRQVIIFSGDVIEYWLENEPSVLFRTNGLKGPKSKKKERFKNGYFSDVVEKIKKGSAFCLLSSKVALFFINVIKLRHNTRCHFSVRVIASRFISL